MNKADSIDCVLDQKMMVLGKKTSILLFIYYVVIMIISPVYAFVSLIGRHEQAPYAALIFCVLLSLSGSTIFYSRKLYKACIGNTYDFEGKNAIQLVGTFFYFLLRPIFAAVFALVTYMIWEASIRSSVNGVYSFSDNHLYVSGIIGFSVGFFTGRVITRMESVGEKHLKGVW